MISNKNFIKILFVSFHTMLIVERHSSDVCCDEFAVPQIDRKSKKIKQQWIETFLFAISTGNDSQN